MRKVKRYHSGMDEFETFVANINALITAEDLEVSQIARAADIDRSHLHRVLSGEQEPGLRRAGKIAKAVGHSLSALLSGPIAIPAK